MQLMCENRGDAELGGALTLAAKLGYAKYVKHLFDANPNTVVSTPDIVSCAAASGFLELIKFFHENEHFFRFTREVMHNAAITNHLHIVKFLHENRTEGCRVSTLFEYDERGHARALEYLRVRRSMAKPARAIARAKREGRTLLAAKLEHVATTTETTYVYV